MPLRRHYPSPLTALALLLASLGAGAEPAPLPEPLTLEAALAQSEVNHPQLAAARARLAAAEAGVEQAQSGYGSRLTIEGRLRWIDPSPIAADQDSADHKASLFWRKKLYDFGRTAGAEEAAEALRDGAEGAMLDARRERRLVIMRDYFAVLRADQRFAIQNEGLAVAYVTLDRLRNRHEMGQVSDIDLLASESDYQKVVRERAEAEQQQRITRARLANTLDRPGQLSATLMPPPPPDLGRELEEIEALQVQAREHNPGLQTLRGAVRAAKARVEAARAGRLPELDGELELSEYSREMGGYDRWRASLNLKVPLYDASVSPAVARAQAELYAAEAALREGVFALDQAVLEQWMRIGALKARQSEVARLAEYRELYLERSRANYEMEAKADLGDAMVRLSEAQLAELEFALDATLAWERLDALLGRPLPLAESAPSENPENREE